MIKRTSLLLLLAALAWSALSLSPLRAQDPYRVASLPPLERDPEDQAARNVIVRFRDGADGPMAERAIREAGGGQARRSAFAPRYVVSPDAGFTTADLLARFRSMPEVDYAEPDGELRAFFTPNDPGFVRQWHMKMVNAERTWDIQKGDSSVVVAVLDSGIAYEDFGRFSKAPDFGNTVFVTGFNVSSRDSHANDDNFHGTHVASTIAESTDNNLGVAGLAFGCALMPVKVLDSRGRGSFSAVAEGIDYATNFSQGSQRVKVINMSLGGEGFSETVRRSVDAATAAGIVVVAAAGNEARGTVSFPAALDNVMAVGALDGRKQKAVYSNFGTALDIVAPGGDIDRDDDGDGRPDGVLQQTFDPRTAILQGRFDDFAYFFVSGTSQATPHVAALAALLVRQGITDPTAVRRAIESTAEDLGTAGRDDTFGHGLIRPVNALTGLGLNK